MGPADSLPLLGLASAAQLQHLLDLEAWRNDRLDADTVAPLSDVRLLAGYPGSESREEQL